MVDILTVVLGFVAVLVAFFFLSGIRVLKEWERMPILTIRTICGFERSRVSLSYSPN